MKPSVLFGQALDRGAEQVTFRGSDGDAWPMAMGRWLAPVDDVDQRVLARAVGPVLDVGCGPGRHVHALSQNGVVAVGVEIAPVAVRHARERGAEVVEGSIFDVAPDPGLWNTALLLDGNIGIGGRPDVLLARIGELLSPVGWVLVEVEPPTTDPRRGQDGSREPCDGQFQVRIESDGTTSAWFPWARVTAEAIVEPAAVAAMRIAEAWCDGGRYFCLLERTAPARS